MADRTMTGVTRAGDRAPRMQALFSLRTKFIAMFLLLGLVPVVCLGVITKRTTEAARERGLILLSCGTHGNVVRILVPLVIADDDLGRGLETLEESLVHAAAG